ncbi:MAG TPA: hypothetical protein VII38_23330 [Polyangia bacterium]|jgi:hypothetical protein
MRPRLIALVALATFGLTGPALAHGRAAKPSVRPAPKAGVHREAPQPVWLSRARTAARHFHQVTPPPAILASFQAAIAPSLYAALTTCAHPLPTDLRALGLPCARAPPSA